MSAYVRVRKHPDLVEAVDNSGTQTDVAALAGISLSRLSQLYTGRHHTIELHKAAALEDTLGVPRGSLFVFTEPFGPLAPYVDNDNNGGGIDGDDNDNSDNNDSDSDDGGEADHTAVTELGSEHVTAYTPAA
jgi:transcriptional regulator with XRE-family HTH domain